jgi:DNA repair protein SbcC/Rad50
VEAHRAERRTVETRITELTSELGDAEVSKETLDAAETAATQLRADLGAPERSEAELKTRIEMLTKAIDRAKELRIDLNRQRAQHSLYRSLALDLRSDRFQACYSKRFKNWSPAPRFACGVWQSVIALSGKMKRSMWLTTTTARQLRSADTLSGGETFLASLALALQLSEQVQKAAEATKLDSLFIDEGFGTLDPEALDAAASAIESLRVGGRMVGIISHI